MKPKENSSYLFSHTLSGKKKKLFNHKESHLESVLLYHKIINYIQCYLTVFYDSSSSKQ